ncbi:MAG: TonB-dependent receptor domain-containing protein [Nevskiaceae bacterium]
MTLTDLDTEAKQISQEFRLGKFDGDGLRWGVGALYWKEDYSSVNASIFIGGFFRNPPSIPAGATWSAAAEVAARGKLAGDLNFRNTEHKSAYVTLAYDVTEQLEVSAEARYSEEQFDYLFGRALSLGVNAATGALNPATFAGSIFTPSSSTDFFAPKLTINYTPVDGKLIYATASKGVKPAGFLNVGVVLDANDAKYNPEELWNYELGFKTSWMDDRLRVNGGLFQMKYTDRIAQILVPDTRSPQGTSTLVRNQGEAKVDGAELEITAALSESVTLSAGYTYLDARFIESEVPNTSALGIAGSGNCRVGNVGAQVVCFTNTNGKSLEQSAKHALVASVAYSREMANGWTLNGEISGQWRSKRFLSPDNLVWLPKHSNVDLQVGMSNDKYTVVAYANNLFDFTGAISAQSYGDPYIAFPVAPPVLAYTTYPADPRQIGVRLGMKF